MALAMSAQTACRAPTSKTAQRLALQRNVALSGGRPITVALIPQRRTGRRERLEVRAENGRGSSFTTGFVLGGAIFGVLGFLFAPQISAALLGDDQRLKLPRFLEDEERDPEATKQDLADKIAQLNSAIDDVSAQLRAQDAQDSVLSQEPSVA